MQHTTTQDPARPAPAPLELKKGTEIQGRYVLAELVGAGGYATVWRATDKVESRDVAIKRLNRRDWQQPDREAAVQEARFARSLKGHKNIVEVYDVIEEQGEVLIVMEYVDGSSLEQVLQKHALSGTWIPVDEAIDYMRQVLEGLLSAHSSGLIHRDIRPANILVSSLGVVKIADFGIARPASFGPVVPGPDRGGGFAGTGSQAFMSYEQARGEQLDQQSDIFSAGIVGYLLFTERHPFNHPSGVFSIHDLIRHDSYACKDLPSRAGLPESVRAAVMRMLTKDRSQRYRSVLFALEELTRGSSVRCPRCSEANPVGSKFCNQCGMEFSAGEDVAAGPSPRGRAVALTNEGFELTKRGEWDEAVRKYMEAIQADPGYGRAYSNLGYALNRQGEYEKAIEYLSKGIEIEDNPNALHRLYGSRGFARSNMKRFPDAIKDFSAAIELNTGNPRVFNHRAEANAQNGDREAASRDVFEALKLDPDYPPALRLRARLEAGRY